MIKNLAGFGKKFLKRQINFIAIGIEIVKNIPTHKQNQINHHHPPGSILVTFLAPIII